CGAPRPAARRLRTGLPRAVGGAGFCNDARSPRERPLHVARVGRGARGADPRGAGLRRCRPRRHVLPSLADGAGEDRRSEKRELAGRADALPASLASRSRSHAARTTDRNRPRGPRGLACGAQPTLTGTKSRVSPRWIRSAMCPLDFSTALLSCSGVDTLEPFAAITTSPGWMPASAAGPVARSTRSPPFTLLLRSSSAVSGRTA